MLCALLVTRATTAAPALLNSLEPDASTVLPTGWQSLGPAPKDAKIELTFALKQQNLDKLESKLLAVSTPSSSTYGKHLCNAEVHRLVAPRDADVQALKSFVPSAVSQTPNGDFQTALMTIAEAEDLLGAHYETLEHATSGVRVHRCTRSGYRLPAPAAAALDFIAPTVHVPGVRSARVQGDGAKATLVAVVEEATFGKQNVPKNLRQLYSVGPGVVGNATAGNKMAVTAFLGQRYSESALTRFWKKYCDGITCGDGLPKLVGDATSGSAGVESMLDIETITGVAGNIEAEFWGFGGRSPDNPANEPFMKWLMQVSTTADEDVPKLFSTSYGEDESSWSMAAAQRLNAEFMKSGARGISLLYAAGDEGANCKGTKNLFVPEGPGSSPYVTAVGGTMPADGFPSPGSESAVGLSSGGFSARWAQPSWQTQAVAGYLSGSTALPPASRGYNTSGRAYPDIAAQATHFCVVPFGCGVAGTSCASPTAAGIIALLNDLRLSAGKPTLGFLNPLFYENAAAFNDITTGESEGCSFTGGGWPAAPGWDAVTGLGTPNYAKLAAIVAKLP